MWVSDDHGDEDSVQNISKDNTATTVGEYEDENDDNGDDTNVDDEAEEEGDVVDMLEESYGGRKERMELEDSDQDSDLEVEEEGERIEQDDDVMDEDLEDNEDGVGQDAQGNCRAGISVFHKQWVISYN